MSSKGYAQRIAELREQRAQLIVRSAVLREALAADMQRLHTPINITVRMFSIGRFLIAHPWLPTLLSSLVLARGAHSIGVVVSKGVRWWRAAHSVMNNLGLIERGK